MALQPSTRVNICHRYVISPPGSPDGKQPPMAVLTSVPKQVCCHSDEVEIDVKRNMFPLLNNVGGNGICFVGGVNQFNAQHKSIRNSQTLIGTSLLLRKHSSGLEATNQDEKSRSNKENTSSSIPSLLDSKRSSRNKTNTDIISTTLNSFNNKKTKNGGPRQQQNDEQFSANQLICFASPHQALKKAVSRFGELSVRELVLVKKAYKVGLDHSSSSKLSNGDDDDDDDGTPMGDDDSDFLPNNEGEGVELFGYQLGEVEIAMHEPDLPICLGYPTYGRECDCENCQCRKLFGQLSLF